MISRVQRSLHKFMRAIYTFRKIRMMFCFHSYSINEIIRQLSTEFLNVTLFCYRDFDKQESMVEIEHLSQSLDVLEKEHQRVKEERDDLHDRLVEYER